jgi:hypothetical protein
MLEEAFPGRQPIKANEMADYIFDFNQNKYYNGKVYRLQNP